MRALLDVNVLLALFDSDHACHGAARRWLEGNIAAGWASCAITQAGFIRIISGARYPAGVSPAEAFGRLAEAVATPHHQYWPCDLALTDPAIAAGRVLGAGQVTDSYLLALAVGHGGRFVTFDRRVALAAAPAARADHLVVLAG
jgi:toxin-antitoxin system PIN domain toxin